MTTKKDHPQALTLTLSQTTSPTLLHHDIIISGAEKVERDLEWAELSATVKFYMITFKVGNPSFSPL